MPCIFFARNRTSENSELKYIFDKQDEGKWIPSNLPHLSEETLAESFRKKTCQDLQTSSCPSKSTQTAPALNFQLST